MSRDLGLLLVLGIVGLTSAFIGLLVGTSAMSVDEVVKAIVGSGDPASHLIVWEIRAPRLVAAFVVGAALGMAGAALQGLLRNPLAEPGVLGVSAVAALCASVSLYFGFAALAPWILPMAAIAGAIGATALLVVAGTITRSVVSLLLIGVGLSSFAGAVMSLLLNLAPNPFSLSDLINWMLGTVANRSFADLALAAPFLCLGAAILATQGRGLAALSLGEEAAAGVGVNLARAQALVVLGAGLLTGAAVSLAGAIGFVGLVAGHLVRGWVGHDPGRALAPAALVGGAALVIADVLVRVAPTESELKLGVMASLIGAPFFIWIIVRREAGRG